MKIEPNYQMTWWEKIVLKFCPSHYGEDEFVRVEYKKLFNRVYVMRAEQKQWVEEQESADYESLN